MSIENGTIWFEGFFVILSHGTGPRWWFWDVKCCKQCTKETMQDPGSAYLVLRCNSVSYIQ